MPYESGASVIDEADRETTRSMRPPVPASGWHQPVLVDDVLRCLAPRPGAVIVDGTVGTGGHSLAILPRLLPDGRLVAIDRDQESLAQARRRLMEFEPSASFVHGDYRHLPRLLQQLGLSRVNGVLVDLGMSSAQVDAEERGFSFLRDGPLDMRMDRSQELTAAALVNERRSEELAALFAQFGEERFARRIAQRIAQVRDAAPIATTTQLARIIVQAVPPAARHGRLHPATRVFQALRIAVNDELAALQDLLTALPDVLAPRGRAVIITFHSLEDRLVKRAFAEGSRNGAWSLLTKKPMRPLEGEIAANARARSAKLRAVEMHP